MKDFEKMIKFGEVKNVPSSNYHNPNSKAVYHYLEHQIKIGDFDYMVNIYIRTSPNRTGRFYIHSIQTKKSESLQRAIRRMQL